jgi:hypothetical protein
MNWADGKSLFGEHYDGAELSKVVFRASWQLFGRLMEFPIILNGPACLYSA